MTTEKKIAVPRLSNCNRVICVKLVGLKVPLKNTLSLTGLHLGSNTFKQRLALTHNMSHAETQPKVFGAAFFACFDRYSWNPSPETHIITLPTKNLTP